MITFDELNAQNHEITELSNVLSYLVSDRFMCDMDITCELFMRYVDKVKDHLAEEDKHLYGPLLGHRDPRVSNMAAKFMSGSVEIKRIFSDYTRKWCARTSGELLIRDHDRFHEETQEMFQLILNRIQDETEHLYPLVRQLTVESRLAG